MKPVCRKCGKKIYFAPVCPYCGTVQKKITEEEGTSAEQDKQDSFDEKSRVSLIKKDVQGGVIFDKAMNPILYLKETKRKQPISSIRHKALSSILNIHRFPSSNLAHLYQLEFEKNDFEHGVSKPEATTSIRYLGVFQSVEEAKKYLATGDIVNLLAHKAPTQRRWSTQELGLSDYTVRS